MVDEAISRQAMELLRQILRHPDPNVRRSLAESFWDLQYLYKFGLPTIPTPTPDLRLALSPQLQPEASLLDRLRLHEEVLMGVIDAYIGDPHPSTSPILRDPSVRLVAAKNLSQRLNDALPLLDKEIAKLEQQVKQ